MPEKPLDIEFANLARLVLHAVGAASPGECEKIKRALDRFGEALNAALAAAPAPCREVRLIDPAGKHWSLWVNERGKAQVSEIPRTP